MAQDGARIVRRLCNMEGFEKREVGGDIILTNPRTHDELKITRTKGNGLYLVHKVAGAGAGTKKPVTFGESFGHGALEANILSQLAGMGAEIREDRLQRKAKREKEARQRADASHRNEEESLHPTPEVTMSDSDPDPIDEVISNLDFATELLLTAINRRARRDGSPRVREADNEGVEHDFWDWYGDLYGVLREEWPAEPGQELPAEPNQEQWAKIFGQLQPHMRRAEWALRLQAHGTNGNATWRVRDDGKSDIVVSEPREIHEETAITAPQSSAPSVASPSTPIPAQPDHTPEETTMKVYVCDRCDIRDSIPHYHCEESNCAFADNGLHPVVGHQNKYRGRDHQKGEAPYIELPCPEKNRDSGGQCATVRISITNWKKHLTDVHPEKYAGKVLCQNRDCILDTAKENGGVITGRWFDSMGEYRTHSHQAHPENLRRNKPNEEEAPKKAPQPVAAAPTRIAPVPVASPVVVEEPARVPIAAAPTKPTPSPRDMPSRLEHVAASSPQEEPQGATETPGEAALRMITEYPVLREENKRLKEENERLSRQVKDQERVLIGFKKKLQTLFDS